MKLLAIANPILTITTTQINNIDSFPYKYLDKVAILVTIN